jgi:MoxR-like ATPase
MPQIVVDFPDREEERRILAQNLPFAPEAVLDYVVGFLQRAHEARERFTVRDGINIARYALKLAASKVSKTKGHLVEMTTQDMLQAFLTQAVRQVLGEEAVDYLF